jgi:enoyl-CoA hydratase
MIELSHRDNITVLTMAHGKANAIDIEFTEALKRAFDDCSRSNRKAMVITARGSIFSAGVDLLRALRGGASYLRTFLPALCRTFETAFAFPKPLVAAVNGHAFAGGCILACAADRRLMAQGQGRIGVPELLVGVPFPTVAFEIMRSAVPPPHLQTLVYSGAAVTGDAALQHGLVDAVVDADRLLDEAIRAASAMAALPSGAFAVAKQQLRAPAFERIREAKDRVEPTIQQMWEAPETLEAIDRYVERTLRKREAL